MEAPIYIVDALRTPRGRGNDKGSLRPLAPIELLAQPLRALAERHALDTAQIGDAIFGCVSQVGEQGSNVGKLGVLAAGWSPSVSAITINRYCASGLSAVQFAALQAQAADGLAVGGGIEMMSRVSMTADQGPLFSDPEMQRRLGLPAIGIAADVVATLEGFTRTDCDRYAEQSQQRATAARAQGRFARSIVAARDADGSALLEADETPRPQTTVESLSAMTPAFEALTDKLGWRDALCARYGLARIEHVHHAGNSPAMADGASAVLVGSEAAIERAGLAPRARVLAFADAGSDPTLGMTGAVAATRRALGRAGLGADDIDLFEVNEAFAALMLHYMKHVGVGHERLNVNGGAIALGHAMGSTGGSLIGIALDELERRGARRACVAICGAAGVAAAMVIERV